MNTASEKSQTNFFQLFSLPEQFELDLPALKKNYRLLQSRYHPDQHVNSENEKLNAVKMSSLLNDAFEVLSKPVKRAVYLMELRGVDIKEDRAIDQEILLEQIELREKLEQLTSLSDLQDKEQALEAMHDQIDKDFKEVCDRFCAYDREGEFTPERLETMKQLLSRMMFLHKLLTEINVALETVE